MLVKHLKHVTLTRQLRFQIYLLKENLLACGFSFCFVLLGFCLFLWGVNWFCLLFLTRVTFRLRASFI